MVREALQLHAAMFVMLASLEQMQGVDVAPLTKRRKIHPVANGFAEQERKIESDPTGSLFRKVRRMEGM